MGETRSILSPESADLTEEDWKKIRSVTWLGKTKPVIDWYENNHNADINEIELQKLGGCGIMGRINASLASGGIRIGMRKSGMAQVVYPGYANSWWDTFRLFRLATREELKQAARKALACKQCGFEEIVPTYNFCPQCGKPVTK